MHSRCAVRDLPTAPRVGAFGLTRVRLPTAVEIRITRNSRAQGHTPDAGQGYLGLLSGLRSQESIEFLAGRIEGALLLLRDAAMNQWALIASDSLHDQLSGRAPA